MRWILLLCGTLCACAPAHAQWQVDDEHTISRLIPNSDGGYTVERQAWLSPMFYKEAGVWYERIQTLQANAGRFEIANSATDRISLDTSSGWLRIQRGNHVLKTRLRWAAYYDRALDSVHVLGTATNGPWTRTGNVAQRAGYMPGVTLRYTWTSNGLKQDIVLSQAARNAMPTPASLGLGNATTWLAWVTQLDTDSLHLSGKFGTRVVNFIDSLEANGDVELIDAFGNVIYTLGNAFAYVASPGGDTTAHSAQVQMTSRYGARNGNKFIVSGAKVLDLNALPAGAITFDPPITLSITEDAWARSAAANQHDDNRASTSWQLGWLTVPTFGGVQDTLYATGDYTPEQWTPSSGSDSWAMLDETTPNTTDYVSALEQDDTTIVTMQDLTPSITVNFHKFDSLVVAVQLRNSAGTNGYIALIADTSGNSINDFFQFDSILTSTSWTTYRRKLFTERSMTASDSLKLGVVSHFLPDVSMQVSWLVGIPYWQTVTADGDALHQHFGVPTSLVRGIDPDDILAWDSIIAYVAIPAAFTQTDSNFHFKACLVTRPDDDFPGWPDWVHRWHGAQPWAAEGAKHSGQFVYENTSTDTYCECRADSSVLPADTGFFDIRLPDTAGYGYWLPTNALDHTYGVVLMPDPIETTVSRRQGRSADDATPSLRPYLRAWATYYPPLLRVEEPEPNDTVFAYDWLTVGAHLQKDTADQSKLDSVVVLRRATGDTMYYPWLNYLGPQVEYGPFDTTGMNLGTGAHQQDYWDIPITAGVRIAGQLPGAVGPCTLQVRAYASRGSGDTVFVPVYIRAESLLTTTVDEIVHVDSNASTFNFGLAPEVRFGRGRNVLFRVDDLPMPEAPAFHRIAHLQRLLRLKRKSGALEARAVQTMRMDSTAWQIGNNDSTVADAGEVTWNSLQHASRPWARPGGDFDSDSLVDTTTIGVITGTQDNYAVINVSNMIRGDSLNVGLRDISPWSATTIDFAPDTASSESNQATLITKYSYVGVSSEPRSWAKAMQVILGAADGTDSVDGVAWAGTSRAVTGMPARPKGMIIRAQTRPNATATASAHTPGLNYAMALVGEDETGVLQAYSYTVSHDQGSHGQVWNVGQYAAFSGNAPAMLARFRDNLGEAIWVRIDAMTNDGFTYTLGFDDFYTGASFIAMDIYAFGGSDILAVDAGIFGAQNTSNNYATRSVPVGAAPFWRPSFMFMLPGTNASSSSWTTASYVAAAGGGFGWTDGTTDWYNQFFERSSSTEVADPFALTWTSVDTAVGVHNTAGTVEHKWGIVGFTPTGFDWRQRRAGGSTTYSWVNTAYLAIRGGRWLCGVDTAQLLSESSQLNKLLPTFVDAPALVLLNSGSMNDTCKTLDPSSPAGYPTTDSLWWGVHHMLGGSDGTSQMAAFYRKTSSDGVARVNGPMYYTEFEGNDYCFLTTIDKTATPTWVQQAAYMQAFQFTLGSVTSGFTLNFTHRAATGGHMFGWVAMQSDADGRSYLGGTRYQLHIDSIDGANMNNVSPTFNYGTAFTFSLRTSGGVPTYSMLIAPKNDPHTPGATIDSAQLVLFWSSGDPTSGQFVTIGGRVLLRNWGEGIQNGGVASAGECSWNAAVTGTTNWTTAGAQSNGNDRSSVSAGTLTINGPVSAGQPCTLRLAGSELTQNFFDNGIIVEVTASTAAFPNIGFYGDDYVANPAFRPYFAIWQTEGTGPPSQFAGAKKKRIQAAGLLR